MAEMAKVLALFRILLSCGPRTAGVEAIEGHHCPDAATDLLLLGDTLVFGGVVSLVVVVVVVATKTGVPVPAQLKEGEPRAVDAQPPLEFCELVVLVGAAVYRLVCNRLLLLYPPSCWPRPRPRL